MYSLLMINGVAYSFVFLFLRFHKTRKYPILLDWVLSCILVYASSLSNDGVSFIIKQLEDAMLAKLVDRTNYDEVFFFFSVFQISIDAIPILRSISMAIKESPL